MVLDSRSEEGKRLSPAHVSQPHNPLTLSQELIKVNALQVAPAELEAVLLEFDPVAESVLRKTSSIN